MSAKNGLVAVTQQTLQKHYCFPISTFPTEMEKVLHTVS